jgi:SAM-dependent methyltransferase
MMDLHDFSDVAENYDRYLPCFPGGDTQAVVDFHLELAQQYGQQGILDIGCGTGATLLPLIQQGYTVTGLDLSAAMLTVLERKLTGLPPETRQRATLVCANMTRFSLPKPVSLTIVPRSAFMHLLTPGDQEQSLRTISQHLTPGGILSLNTFDPDYTRIAANLKGSHPTPNLRAEYTNFRGNKERVSEVIEYDPASQVMGGIWIFEEFNPAGELLERRERPLHMRWTFETEMRHLLRLCGFEVLEVYSSYRKDPRRYGGGLLWVARKVE